MVTSLVLLEVMSELRDYGVDPAAVVLKPNMALPGGRPASGPAPGKSRRRPCGR